MHEYTQNLGAIDDFRSEELKAKDYKFEETVSAPAPVTWVEKAPATWKKYPTRNQDGSSTCVAQTMAKIVGVLLTQEKSLSTFPVLSATSIYKRRSNASEGMIGVEAFDIARKNGLAPDAMLPSENLSEAQVMALNIDKYVEGLEKAASIGGFVQFTAGDFDSVASTIQHTGKPVMVWFRFGPAEWTDVPTVSMVNPPYHHSVTAVDVTLYGGKKAIIIEDSWGRFGLFDGQRVITEDFFRARNTFAAYPINLKVEQGVTPKPTDNMPATCKFGERSPAVKAIQDFLKWDGTFPKNIESTGFYGAITARAVKAFGVKYGIALSDPQGRLWGTSEFNHSKTL